MAFRGKPSGWLLKNSSGYPDFLFTILTYSMLLLALVTLIWISFGILAYLSVDNAKANIIIKVMDSLKTGLISLVGVVFGLAGSYTVRRFKKDDHYVQKQQMEHQVSKGNQPTESQKGAPGDLQWVQDEEDI